MKTWELIMSRDAIDIYATEIIYSDEEPGFWECYAIADNYECDWWYVEEVEEI